MEIRTPTLIKEKPRQQFLSFSDQVSHLNGTDLDKQLPFLDNDKQVEDILQKFNLLTFFQLHRKINLRYSQIEKLFISIWLSKILHNDMFYFNATVIFTDHETTIQRIYVFLVDLLYNTSYFHEHWNVFQKQFTCTISWNYTAKDITE